MDTNTPDSDDNVDSYFKNFNNIQDQMDTNQDKSISFHEFIQWMKNHFLKDIVIPTIFFSFAIIAWSAVSDTYYIFKDNLLVVEHNKINHVKFNIIIYIISAFIISFGPGLQNLI
jgi:hypothetical protein